MTIDIIKPFWAIGDPQNIAKNGGQKLLLI
jgi:hypothetical protein